MNATVRALLVFGLLIGAVVLASLGCRGPAKDPGAKSAADDLAGQPVDMAELHPELKSGLEAYSEDRVEDALQHLRAVPEEAPNYPIALTHIAILTARGGDFDAALESLLRLVQQRPEDPEVHAALGWVFFLAERYEDAEFAALRALELDPVHLATRYNVGLYRVAQGRSQLALTSYIRAMNLDTYGAQVTRHRDRLRSLHDAQPDLVEPHYALAFFADSMQDPRTEIEELEHYLALAVDSVEKGAAAQKLEDLRAEVGGS
jgi:tetratricopeptide (TPR) repeat protein